MAVFNNSKASSWLESVTDQARKVLQAEPVRQARYAVAAVGGNAAMVASIAFPVFEVYTSIQLTERPRDWQATVRDTRLPGFLGEHQLVLAVLLAPTVYQLGKSLHTWGMRHRG